MAPAAAGRWDAATPRPLTFFPLRPGRLPPTAARVPGGSEDAMNRDEYLKFHADFCGKALALSAAKNHDYAGERGNDPFANFRRCSLMGIC